MNKQTLNLLWTVALIAVAAASFFLVVSEVFDFDLPDALETFFGVVDLIAVPALVWATVSRSRAAE